MTPYFKKVVSLIKEGFHLEVFPNQRLGLVKTRKVYEELVTTPPPPKVLAKHPGISWERVWRNLQS